ncbi:UDP-N-acetylmuramoyl-L-alanine--D-glutamate ligase [bacterium]|nr:UDP-N-acetylmuramoyl-L-alanine--D-glutamate ligase [bacterium]
MDIRGKKISVIGMGKTGVATAEALASHNEITIFDKKEPLIPPQLKDLPVKFHLGDPNYTGAEEADLIIISPGVPKTEPFISRALAHNVPIRSEIEIAYKLCKSPIIAVTGTDGKSTTVSLIAHILQVAGKRAIACGNIGTPFISIAPSTTPEDIVVLEVSSYQLEWIEEFRPKIGMVLNIAADHLERYNSLEEYAFTKMRLFENQTGDDFAILNRDDETLLRLSHLVTSNILFFSLSPFEGEGVYFSQGEIHMRLRGEDFLFPLPETALEGKHNLQNMLCASLASFLVGVSLESISKALSTFPPLEHRMERIGYHKGALFINDSKATNPHATSKALSSFSAPIILIAGGKYKEGADYEGMFRENNSKIKAVILIGEASSRLENIAKAAGISNVYREKDLEGAVRKASELASPGNVVLFSPACSSFDMFTDFEERGRRFKEIFFALREES